jgi:hypothetical protein
MYPSHGNRSKMMAMTKPAQKKISTPPTAVPPPPDPVDEASEESFPASDAPAWIGGSDAPPNAREEESPKPRDQK